MERKNDAKPAPVTGYRPVIKFSFFIGKILLLIVIAVSVMNVFDYGWKTWCVIGACMMFSLF